MLQPSVAMIFLFAAEAESGKLGNSVNAFLAFAGAVVTAIVAWRKDLNQLSRGTRELEYLNKRAELMQTLLDLQGLIEGRTLDKRSLHAYVQSEVESIKTHLAEGRDIRYELRHFSRVGRLRRLLLIYKPMSRSTWFPRVLFYLLGLLFGKVTLDALGSLVRDEDWPLPFILSVIVFVTCFVMRSVSISSDERSYDWQRMWENNRQEAESGPTWNIEKGSILAIASRLCSAFAIAGKIKAFERSPTIASIAELLGDTSTLRIENALNGRDGLTFFEMKEVCGVLGIHREWLLDGSSCAFYQRTRYSSADDFFKAIGKREVVDADGDHYESMIFALRAGEFPDVAIFSYTSKNPYRVESLLISSLNDWDMVLVCAITAASGPVSKLVENSSLRHGIIIESSDFQELIEGRVHPAAIRERHIAYQHWNEDIWDLDLTDPDAQSYTSAYEKSSISFKTQAANLGIRNNADLVKHATERYFFSGISLSGRQES